MKSEQVARRAALALLVVVSPFLLLGAALTMSLFGAVFGLPLLVVTIPPALIAWRVRTDPSDRALLRRLAVAGTLVAGALTLAIVSAAAVGYDDLDTRLEWGLLAAAIAWAAAAWAVAFTARTLDAAT